ncbi:hypothetical protein [Haloarcula argentinensis]|uniref:hypothetical protein n=1 Tax=Haloarcula argentinensis TaxID=43776 RepID=UPI0002B15581|nr:hypothetical protein [Haloarcula argentinensis]EMA19024.1 hypothetical protein C443_17978 [Haloarcula argentinensis DSM 12282]
MSQTQRPWYVHDVLADDYCEIARSGGDLRMLKTLKILRTILVNAGIIGIALTALFLTNADATIITVLSIATLGLYNGIDAADYAALATAFAEVRSQQTTNRDDN